MQKWMGHRRRSDSTKQVQSAGGRCRWMAFKRNSGWFALRRSKCCSKSINRSPTCKCKRDIKPNKRSKRRKEKKNRRRRNAGNWLHSTWAIHQSDSNSTRWFKSAFVGGTFFFIFEQRDAPSSRVDLHLHETCLSLLCATIRKIMHHTNSFCVLFFMNLCKKKNRRPPKWANNLRACLANQPLHHDTSWHAEEIRWTQRRSNITPARPRLNVTKIKVLI